jgi:hypothetical protein
MRRLAPLVLLLVVAGCDGFSGEEQRLFEVTAISSPSDGVTSDDWRVGPFYGARVQVIDRDQTTPGVEGVSPNPAQPDGDVVLQVYADEGPGGFALYRRRPDGELDLIQAVNGVAGPNIYTFTFFGSEVSATGAPGSYRLVVLDGLERVVTYGDLVLQ